jgi:hypothetical protein
LQTFPLSHLGTAPKKENPLSWILRAGNGTRTRDINLGKVALYQLSYSRKKVHKKLQELNKNEDKYNVTKSIMQQTNFDKKEAAQRRLLI